MRRQYLFQPLLPLDLTMKFQQFFLLTRSYFIISMWGDIEELTELEKTTMCQDTESWCKERGYRVTASNVHTILHSKKGFTELAQSLSFPPKDLSGVLPIRLGKMHEAMVKNILRHNLSCHVFRNTGLVLHPLYPFIGVSPDGLLYNEQDTMAVEVKCLFKPAQNCLECL